MAATRWARVRPGTAWKRPGLPTEWVRVLDHQPADVDTPLLPGYCWIEVQGRPRLVWAAHLDFREED